MSGEVSLFLICLLLTVNISILTSSMGPWSLLWLWFLHHWWTVSALMAPSVAYTGMWNPMLGPETWPLGKLAISRVLSIIWKKGCVRQLNSESFGKCCYVKMMHTKALWHEQYIEVYLEKKNQYTLALCQLTVPRLLTFAPPIFTFSRSSKKQKSCYLLQQKLSTASGIRRDD